MKISGLAKKFNVSKDTIHYYVNLGLLAPKRNGGLWDFTEKDEEDLRYIQRLKQMEFNLKEIRTIFVLKRLSNWVEPSTLDDYRFMLKEKLVEVNARLMGLEQSRQLLEEEMEAVARIQRAPSRRMGVPVRALPLLCCPRCGKPLSIDQAKLQLSYIQSGRLSCPCGYAAAIQDGVVLTGNRYTEPYDRPDLKRGLYRKGMSDEFADDFQKCAAYCLGELERISLSGKVVLEANVNGYSFLYNHMREMDPSCLFIIVDKYPETILMYKELVELLDLDLDILYIADAQMDYPLKRECVDFLFSYFGENEHQLYHPESFIEAVQPFLKLEAAVLGAYIGYDAHARSRKNLKQKYPEAMDHAYCFPYLEQDYRRLGYRIDWTEAGHVESTPDIYSFSCHIEGEPLRVYYFRAERQREGDRTEKQQAFGGS